VLLAQCGAGVRAAHPDVAADVRAVAGRLTPEGVLARLDAVLGCREAIELNVKPRIAVEAMTVALRIT
jgi:DNA polymerase-3 subunit delta'